MNKRRKRLAVRELVFGNGSKIVVGPAEGERLRSTPMAPRLEVWDQADEMTPERWEREAAFLRGRR